MALSAPSGPAAISLLERLAPPPLPTETRSPGSTGPATGLQPMGALGVVSHGLPSGLGGLGLLAGWLLVQQQWLGPGPRAVYNLPTGALPERRVFLLDPALCAAQWWSETARQWALAPLPAAAADAPERDATGWLSGPAQENAPVMLPAGVVLAFQEMDGPVRSLRLHFNPQLLDEEQADALLQATIQAASGLADEPGRVAGSIAVVSGPAARQLTQQEEAGGVPLDPSWTVHGLLARQVAEHPDAEAVCAPGLQLSYADLQCQASSLSAWMRQQGVQPGDTVALAMGRSAPAVVAMVAILQAGAAYLPLDTGFPAARLERMREIAGARWVLAHRAQADAFTQWPGLLLLEEGQQAPVATAAAVAEGVSGASLACVMFTSGSTGTPKAIAIPHRALLRLVHGIDYAALAPGCRVLHAAPLGFDAASFEIWGPLLNGGCCVIHAEEVASGAGLAATVREHRVEIAWLTAALFNAVVDDDPQHLAGLKQLLTGGEALSVPHVRRAMAALPALGLINGYGPTECTTFAATHALRVAPAPEDRSIPIGRPMAHTTLRVLGPGGARLPGALMGELCIGGMGLASGYLGAPDLTSERFITDPHSATGRLYRSGDLARWRSSGVLEFLGRSDSQVKIRGLRIELGEIESALMSHPGIQAAAVLAVAQGDTGDHRLVAYLVSRPAHSREPARAQAAPVAADADLKAHLGALLPAFMLPSAFVWLPELPRTPNGKLDRRALPPPSSDRPEISTPYEDPTDEDERALAGAFAQVLGIRPVGRHDNFFELGGNSLGVMRVLTRLAATGLPARWSATDFFRLPTPAGLAASARAGTPAVAAPAAPAAQPVPLPLPGHTAHEPIAIIGMAGRFPGAGSVEQLWNLLCEGREGIRFFQADELDPSLPPGLTHDPAYVKARGVLPDVGLFDAGFFGIPPKEAALMDPQQRIFLELCWECMESAGHAPDRAEGPVGVFAGMYNASYYQRHLAGRDDLIQPVGEFAVMLGNEKDYIATRVAHRLNLKGPAVSVHTACSTSLVAVVQAMGSLRLGQCRMALAGGASVTCPPHSGHLYQEGAMLSPDGHTRSFDDAGQGTVFSDGAAVLLLKRLSDAQADGDTIHAVLRGGAINNDGGGKASFTAPSVQGQAEVISAALRDAGVPARSISYLEAHGTATPLGDPVEIAALTQAYRSETADRGFCAIGSLKSNLGHLVVAAGAAGLIKTALALSRQSLPPSLHYTGPGRIDFQATPFTVNTRLRPWPRGEQPRRAGVSAFGVGGTNAHVIVEEAPQLAAPAGGASPGAEGPQLLVLSARSATALAESQRRLAAHLGQHPQQRLADVAHTLRVGRGRFAHRACVVAEDAGDAARQLLAASSTGKVVSTAGPRPPQVVLAFPGQGSHYPGMGRALADTLPGFAEWLSQGLGALPPPQSQALRQALLSDDPQALRPTALAQPALYLLCWSLAQVWQRLGLAPVALVGHSVGEFVAAALSGVWSMEEGLRLVSRRAELMQAMPAGAMLSAALPAGPLLARLPAQLSLAAENGPNQCVVAGPEDAVALFEASLQADLVATRRLHTSHAFHSAMMDPAVQAFEDELTRRVARGDLVLKAPATPIVSTLTGERLRPQEATDPAYWARHLRGTVRFAPAMTTLQRDFPGALLLEAGPRQGVAALARQNGLSAVATLSDRPGLELGSLKLAAGRLWALGAPLDLAVLEPALARRRVPLPTYPFERQLHWVPARAATQAPAPAGPPPGAPGLAPVPVPVSPAYPPAPPDPPTTRPTMPEVPSMNSAPPTTAPAGRLDQLTARVRSAVEDISGISMAPQESAASFIELGLDSLQLTQLALQLKRTFKVDVSFRQLMGELRSAELLAAHLERHLPAEAVPAAPVPTAAAVPSGHGGSAAAPAPAAAFPAGSPAPLGALAGGAPLPYVQQVIAQQMALMAQQLALLQGVGPAGQPPAAAATPAAGDGTGSPAVGTLQPAEAAVPPPEQAGTATAPPSAAQARSAADPASSAPAAPAAPAGPGAGMATYDVKTAFGAIARIHATPHGPLTERQQLRLDAFIRRYTGRTAASKAYTQAHRAHLADPRVVNGFRPALKEITYQLVVQRSKGSRVWDLDGHEYIDILNGFGMNLFGWSPEFVQQAVRDQMELGYEIGPQHPLAGEVAQQLCELTGFDRAGLCNTGSEAVMGAVRIARTITGRPLVVIFTGSYHGIFDEVIVRGTRQLRSVPAAPGIMPSTAENVLVLDYGSDEALKIIQERMDDIAAVLVEPVQSRRPDLQPLAFLQRLRQLTADGGALLVFDEVVTGFRVHPRGAQGHFGIQADLATYGKVVGGGFPIGVIAGKREFMDALDGGHWQFGDDSTPTVGVTYFAGTFVRHPLALAAARAVLYHLKAQGPALQQSLGELTAGLAASLNAFFDEAGAPLVIKHFGSVWKTFFLEDHPMQDLLFAMLRSRGIHVLDNFPCFMTTAHTAADVAAVVQAFKESVLELQEADFLPRRQPARPAMLDASAPPVPGARLGKDPEGRPAWYVPHPDNPKKFIRVGA